MTEEGIREHAPEGPAALQMRREEGLVDYEGGRSAMVCYLFASESAESTLLEAFGDEAAEPGARGEGALEFRYIEGEDEALKEHLAKLVHKFVQSFGETPLFNREPDA
jgi:hypothetical protein